MLGDGRNARAAHFCFAAIRGRTKDAALKNVQEAITLILEWLAESGQPIPVGDIFYCNV